VTNILDPMKRLPKRISRLRRRALAVMSEHRPSGLGACRRAGTILILFSD
jgi:hypothetical protein